MDKHRHRPGSLHQSNKPFKSRHATKSILKEQSKGKVNRTPVRQAGAKLLAKQDRRQAAKNLQQKKREELARKKRLFEGRHGTPKIVPVLPLCPDSDVDGAIAALYRSLDQDAPPSGEASIVNVERFKQKLQFVPLRRNFVDVIDAFKVADFGIVLLSAEVEVDKLGINCLLAILNQGLVDVVPVIQHLDQAAPKLHKGIQKSLIAFIQQFFPEETDLFSLDSNKDVDLVLRYLTGHNPKPLAWRDLHPYMLASAVEFEPGSQTDTGMLKVTGFARGNPFNANRLVHLQSFGDYQLHQITTAPLPSGHGSMQEDAEVVGVPTMEEQDDLIAENEPDFMENEQTWPTEEEIAEAEERARKLRNGNEENSTRRVPKGTSSYQAAWIVDDEDEEYSDDDQEEDADMAMGDNAYNEDDVEPADSMGILPASSDEEYEDVALDSKEEAKDELDAEEEEKQYEEYLKKRQSEFADHREFPDEIDTPMHKSARERFARYRGLQSFRTSHWDPYENLPVDYSRIFQFENYNRTKSRVTNQAIVGSVKSGTHITLWIKDVPKAAFESYRKDRPFIVFGLLQYEHKMSLLNFQITRDNAYEEPVRSKDPLVMHVGFRRYKVQPIYSQNTSKGTNHVHKFERFLQNGKSSVATVYGPTMFGKTPCMFYKETEDINEPILVSTGTFMDTDVKRITAKRIILSGHPFRVHKRSAVIRYMFFNPEDVLWFKPVQLSTKYGRVGHIRESLGTHGYMKCMFDGPLTQQDTVMMCLYKRMYPKWNTELWTGGLDTTAQAAGEVKAMKIDMD